MSKYIAFTGALAAIGSLITAPAALAQPDCSVDLSAPEVVSAVKSQNPGLQREYGWDWDSDPTYMTGNYNRCAPLSVALTSVERGTGSSPDLAVFFHNGQFVGPASTKYYAFISLNQAATTPDTVVLNYKDPNSCSACEGPIYPVRYKWQGDHVQALDPLPAMG